MIFADRECLLGHVQHQEVYVFFSLIVAVLGSWTAIDLFQQVRSNTGRSKLIWVAITAVAMGTSIFSMHFIAMIGIDIGMPIRYDLLLTFVSLIVAVSGTAVAFYAIRSAPVSPQRLLLAAIAMGSSICLMHYVGMYAMRVSASVSYDTPLVIASWVIAVVVSGVALASVSRKRSLALRVAGAVILGLAVFSMHFTAMAAMTFEASSHGPRNIGHLDQFSLALWVGSSTLLLLFLALVSAMYDRQLQLQRTERLQRQLQHASGVNSMVMMGSTLAHELNQPLAAASNYLTAVRRMLDTHPSENPKLEFGIGEAQSQILRAGEIIKRVRCMVSQAQTTWEEVTVATLCEQALEICRASAACGLPRISVIPDGQAELVYVDVVQTQQVLVNLIRNGCEAVSGLADPQLVLSAHRYGDAFCEVRVSDNGPGIPEAKLDALFDAFGGSNASGLGVGLSISRTIIEAQGGKIWAKNNAGRGCSFHFTLPRRKAVETQEEPAF